MNVPAGFAAYRSEGSGVTAFRIGQDFIDVAFIGGAVYRYTTDSAGRQNILEMQRLAAGQRGLSTYISRVTRHLFAQKLA